MPGEPCANKKKKVTCICPFCRVEHIVRMNWTGGKFKPRVYCREHEHLAHQDSYFDETNAHSTPRSKIRKVGSHE